MNVVFLEPGMPLPESREAGPSGLVAVGGDLRPETLVDAYSKGAFPWYEEEPILWFSPDPRMVLRPDDLILGRSVRRALARDRYCVRFDTAFDEVIRACATTRRPGQRGTWINPAMIEAYGRLHEIGVAHSVEAWCDGRLAGGLYGVSIGGAFFGESMFATGADASKVAFVHLVGQLRAWGFRLIDCQIHTDLMGRFGALEWSRSRFLRSLKAALKKPTRRGRWTLDPASRFWTNRSEGINLSNDDGR